ncbi:aldehyde dehydrogenase family protein [Nocardia sp. NPDC057353]|uniref:aldehyde dehydrogenase family protein n=1 Tax=Nocardia sp. NPDC057353 TaxID=3346104 RepID=UPI003632406C
MSSLDYDAFFIGGKWRPASSADRIAVVSPSTEEQVGSVPAATAEDVDAAVAAARAAAPGWRALTPAERAGHIERLAAAMLARSDELAQLITTEQGGTHLLSQVYQSISGAMSFNYNAEVAREFAFEEVRVSDLSRYAGSDGGSIIPMAGKSLVVREPVGVVALLPAFNFAVPAIGQKAGPALAAGCTVVLKVPEQNPLASFAVGRIMAEIDFPAGVLNIIAARADGSEYLVTHPDVDMVSFTGSTAVGRAIARNCAELVRPVVLELGGKSAAIVLDDADPAVVVPTLTAVSVGTNSGQSCVCPSRFLVPEARYEEYAEAFAAAFAALPVGDPWDANTAVGPLITEAHRAKVERDIARAREQGATVRTGGGRPAGLDRGWYLEPTLLTGVSNDMEIAQEEVFGPVVALIPYTDEDDAVAIANDSKYGLSGSVYTGDVLRGFAVARRIETGAFSINTLAADLGSPFGGYKQSGIGREHGPTAIEEFLRTKTISIDPTGELPEQIVAGRARGTGPGTA